jgi:hypothetical protein
VLQRRPGKKRTVAKALVDTTVSVINVSSMLSVDRDLAQKYTCALAEVSYTTPAACLFYQGLFAGPLVVRINIWLGNTEFCASELS